MLKQCCQTALNDDDGDGDMLPEEEALHCIHQLGTVMTIMMGDMKEELDHQYPHPHHLHVCILVLSSAVLPLPQRCRSSGSITDTKSA